MLIRITRAMAAVALAAASILSCSPDSLHAQDSVSSSRSDGSSKTKDDAKKSANEEIVNFQILQQGTYSGLKDPIEKIVPSREEWEEIWKKHVSLLVPQPPLPPIDFDSFVVVVITSGEKRTGGYSIELKDVVTRGDDVVVTYRRIDPAPNSFTMQVLTQPFLMVQVQKPKGSVKLAEGS